MEWHSRVRDHKWLVSATDRRQGLVGRLAGVDPDPHPLRIGHQSLFQQPAVVRVLHALLVFAVGLAIVRATVALAQLARGPHGGALAIGRLQPGEGEPGLVPEKYQVRLDRQILFHDPLDVVDDAVEGAVGEQQHLDPIELAGGAQHEQLALDLLERHGTVHGELVEGIGVQIDRFGPGQHQAVVVGFVAVLKNELLKR